MNSDKRIDELSFDECMNIYSDYYHNKNQKAANKEAYNSLVEMGIIEGKSNHNYRIIGGLCLIIILSLGFIVSMNMIYIFGFVFYAAAMAVPKEGGKEIWVIYTHGLTGMGIMTGTLIFNGNLSNTLLITIIGVVLILSSFIVNHLCIISPKYKTNEIYKYLHYFLAIGGLLIVAFADKISMYIKNIV